LKSNIHGVYYTNSIHFAYDAPMSYMERLEKAVEISHSGRSRSDGPQLGGENLPDTKALFNLARYVLENTECAQYTISPEFTICKDCQKTTPGLREKCPFCDSDHVVQLTRVTGYYVIVDKFNAGKKAELHDRRTDDYKIK
jgi:ribonucleoside-triphosphate reductase